VGCAGVQDERILERYARYGPALCPEPALSGELGPVESVERRSDLAAADLDGDRFRYPC
jgi:hypothetical protein